jgi:uncharacterized protein (TIGR02001 family)
MKATNIANAKMLRPNLGRSRLQHLCLIGALSLLAVGNATAQDKKPDHEITANASLTTDYRYRGISQTRLKPALQGGVDYVNNPTGMYLGAWASTIKWVKDGGGDSQIEIDLYGGKRGELTKDINYDVGAIAYIYPSSALTPNPNTFEVYGQLSYGPAYIKYSHGVSNLFGFANTKNSGYLDLGANIDAGGGYTINLHLGRQTVKNLGVASFTDYKVGVTKDFGICTVALAVIGADTKYYVGPNSKNLGKTSAVLSVSKTF